MIRQNNDGASVSISSKVVRDSRSSAELPLLSVLVPVKDGQSHLSNLFEALNDRPPEVEVIFLDDGSTDDSHRLLSGYVERHVGSLLLHNERALGVGIGRKQLLGLARGRFVWFVDCDDLPLLPVALGLLQRFPDSDVILAQAHMGRGTTRASTAVDADSCSGATALQALSYGIVDGYLWNKIFRSSLFRDHGWPLLSTQEDLCMVATALSRSARVQSSDTYIYHHFFHQTSIMRSRPPELRNIAIASDYVRSLLVASSDGAAPKQVQESLTHFLWSFEVRSYATLPLYARASRGLVDDGLRRASSRLSAMSNRSLFRLGIGTFCSALTLKWTPRVWFTIFAARRRIRTRSSEALRRLRSSIINRLHRYPREKDE